MKFKVGDKVITRIFSETDYVGFDREMLKHIGREYIIKDIFVNDNGDLEGYYLGCGFTWIEEALELVQEELKYYFYVGQEVYSPLFQNKERKGVVSDILLDTQYPIRCETDISIHSFTFDGKKDNKHDFISLFQEPITFLENKPLEKPLTFEKGEIVEVSDNEITWLVAYYICASGNYNYPYKVCTIRKEGEFTNPINYAKIRKVSQTS